MSEEERNPEDNDLSGSSFNLELEAQKEARRRQTEYDKIKLIHEELEVFMNRYKKGKYRKLIYETIQENKESIEIDFNDIMDCSTKLWEIFRDDPLLFMQHFKDKLYNLEYGNEYFKEENYFNIRIANHYLKEKIAKISVKHNTKLVQMRGYVSKLSERKPYIFKFYMYCKDCDYHEYRLHEDGHCRQCEGNPRLKNDENLNVYTTCNYIRIQELNEDLEGRVPLQMECIVLGDLCDDLKAGMKVNLTAFIHLRRIKSSMSERTPFVLSAVANNISPLISNDLENLEKARITPEDEVRFAGYLENRPKLLKMLVNSFAPHILGMEMVKLASLLSIVGAGKMFVYGFMVRDRMHIILIGDPGTGKTEILKFGERITLGSLMASAQGVSGKGLTALTLKEPDGTFSIQPGALIFANGSTFYFDEIDKTNDETRGHLHESMESGTVTVMKGGQMATLQAETTIISGCNPKYSRYNEEGTLADNINLPDSLISRFDFIFIIKDVIEESKDRSVSRHIDSIFVHKKIPTYGQEILSILDLIKYINYVKKQDLDPDISQAALKKFEDYYVLMRQKSTSETIAITPRQKGAMLRSAKALGRLLLMPIVDEREADIIIKLMDYEVKTVFTDKDGNINVVETEGKTVGKLRGAKLMIEILKQLEKQYAKDKLPKKQIRKLLADDHKMKDAQIEKFLVEMSDIGIIQQTMEGYVRRATND